jgi:hypothetical protein
MGYKQNPKGQCYLCEITVPVSNCKRLVPHGRNRIEYHLEDTTTEIFVEIWDGVEIMLQQLEKN